LYFIKNITKFIYSGDGDKQLAVNFEDLFNSKLEKAELPVCLAPGDQHNFILCIDPLLPAYPNFPSSSGQFKSKLMLIWNMESIQDNIRSTYDSIAWAAPKSRDLIIAISSKSPVIVNHIFSVRVTITNVLDTKRDLVLNANSCPPHGVEVVVPTHRISDTPRQRADTQRNVHHLESYDILERNRSEIVCMQKSIDIGIVNGKSAISVNLDCIAYKEGLYHLELQVYDKGAKNNYTAADPCEI